MAGGRRIREDGLRNIASTNIFSSLETRRKKPIKKTSDKDEEQEFAISALPPPAATVQESMEPAPWTRTPVSVTSWADCEDDDQDFAMLLLPPLPSLASETAEEAAEEQEKATEEDGNENSEVIDDDGNEGYDDAEEGNEENKKPPLLESKAAETCVIPHTCGKEPNRQLSKRELKKKGLAELEAALSELGLNQVTEKDDFKVSTTNEGAFCDGNTHESSGPSVAVSKSFKRRKAKKERPANDSRQEELHHGGEQSSAGVHEATSGHQDKNELVRKLPSVKKKKSKDNSSAAKAVGAEAAVRAAKLAAAKKKEKNHYNQPPR